MKFVELTQGTPEWLAFRKNKIGGSDIASICGVSGAYKSRKKVMEEKLGLDLEKENSFRDKIFQDGHEWEAEVRKSFEDFDPCVLQSEENESFIASLDGLSGETILEIKSTSSNKILYPIKDGICPKIYLYQINWQLMVSGLKRAKLAVVDKITGELFVLEINRDDELCDLMKKEAEEFLAEINSNSLPIKNLEIVEMKNLFEKKSAIKALQKKIDEIDEEIKKQAEELLKEYQATKIVGCGVVIEMLERKGSVDYSLIPELNGVDLEKYRKKSTKYVAIKELK